VKYFGNDISLIHTASASAYFIDEEMHLYPMTFKQQTSTRRTLPLHIVDVNCPVVSVENKLACSLGDTSDN